METRCADHATPLYPQKLALTSPTGGGRSVGIVRSRPRSLFAGKDLAGDGRGLEIQMTITDSARRGGDAVQIGTE